MRNLHAPAMAAGTQRAPVRRGADGQWETGTARCCRVIGPCSNRVLQACGPPAAKTLKPAAVMARRETPPPCTLARRRCWDSQTSTPWMRGPQTILGRGRAVSMAPWESADLTIATAGVLTVPQGSPSSPLLSLSGPPRVICPAFSHVIAPLAHGRNDLVQRHHRPRLCELAVIVKCCSVLSNRVATSHPRSEAIPAATWKPVLLHHHMHSPPRPPHPRPCCC
jgi:hypothetical protein